MKPERSVTYVLSGVLQGLLDKMYEIWGAKLPERAQRFRTSVNRFMQYLFSNPMRNQTLALA